MIWLFQVNIKNLSKIVFCLLKIIYKIYFLLASKSVTKRSYPIQSTLLITYLSGPGAEDAKTTNEKR